MAERSARRLWLTRKIVQPLEGAVARALFALLRSVPIDRASAVGGWLARTIGPRIGISRRARRNLERAFPDRTRAEIDAIIVDMWDNLGRVAAELPHVSRLDPFANDGRFELCGFARVDTAKALGKPMIFFAGHLANWEIPAMVGRRYGVPAHLIYRPANNPWIDELYREGREFAHVLIAKGAVGARLAIEALKNGQPLGLLIDQKMNDGIAVPFFGRDAMTAPALGSLALRFDCTVLPVQVERLGGARFRVTIHPPLELARSGDRQQDIYETMRRANALLEDWIRQRPGQWLWLHRRWPD